MKKKLKIEDLKIKSFITSIDEKEKGTIQGANLGGNLESDGVHGFCASDMHGICPKKKNNTGFWGWMGSALFDCGDAN